MFILFQNLLQIFYQYVSFVILVILFLSLIRLVRCMILNLKLIEKGCRQGGLYVLEELWVPDVATLGIDLSYFHLNSSSSFYLRRSRHDHGSTSLLGYLVSQGSLGKLQTCDIFYCNGCKLAKFSALPFNRSVSSLIAPFGLIHSDVWGLLLLIQKRVPNIIFLLLMIIWDIVGFLNET